MAIDGGTPPRMSTATVQITVERNLNAPEFQPNRYEREVLETQALGEPIVTVTARDLDVNVSIVNRKYLGSNIVRHGKTLLYYYGILCSFLFFYYMMFCTVYDNF